MSFGMAASDAPLTTTVMGAVEERHAGDISADFDSDRTDYRAVLDYHITDDLMTYAQVATGYKGGGVNPRPFFIVQIETFEPEKMTSVMERPRRCLALCSPMHHRIESTMFDLPQPFGPTMPMTSVSKCTTVRSQNDLNPLISSFRMRISEDRRRGTGPQRPT